MFSRMLRLASLAALVAAVSIPSAAGVKLGRITVGAGFGYGFSPYCCYSPFSYYDAFYGPYWGPFGPLYPPGYFAYPGPIKGTVRLSKADKNADIYIDNAYAGKVSHLKTMSMDPGAYDLEVRSPDGKSVHKRIYVLSGKTLKLEF